VERSEGQVGMCFVCIHLFDNLTAGNYSQLLNIQDNGGVEGHG
jgi:hypothetical protein